MGRHDLGTGNGAEEPPEPPRLRQLRRLVNALLLTLIVAVITVTALLVIRFGPFLAGPGLPDGLTLPPGERAAAVTLGRDWIAVVTTDGEGRERIRVLDRATGLERAATLIAPPE